MFGKSFVTLFLVIFFPFVLAQNSAAPIEKARSPLHISINALTTPSEGQAVDFEVNFSSAVDLNAIQVSVLPSSAVTIHRGELNWQGDLIRGEMVSFQFNASVPLGVNAYIQVIARNYQHFAALAEYKPPGIDTRNAITASVVKKKSVVRSGRKIVEYPLR